MTFFLNRRIVILRKVRDVYRRHDEIHRQQLFKESGVSAMLESVGFQVKIVRSYGKRSAGEGVFGLVSGAVTVILHSRNDDVVPFADSQELVRNSGLPASALIEVGSDHRLADEEPLERMLRACAK